VNTKNRKDNHDNHTKESAAKALSPKTNSEKMRKEQYSKYCQTVTTAGHAATSTFTFTKSARIDKEARHSDNDSRNNAAATATVS